MKNTTIHGFKIDTCEKFLKQLYKAHKMDLPYNQDKANETMRLIMEVQNYLHEQYKHELEFKEVMGA